MKDPRASRNQKHTQRRANQYKIDVCNCGSFSHQTLDSFENFCRKCVQTLANTLEHHQSKRNARQRVKHTKYLSTNCHRTTMSVPLKNALNSFTKKMKFQVTDCCDYCCRKIKRSAKFPLMSGFVRKSADDNRLENSIVRFGYVVFCDEFCANTFHLSTLQKNIRFLSNNFAYLC